jgi:hypothetical protein
MSDQSETAEYLKEMAGQMTILAGKHRLELARKLFEMAHLSLSQELGIAKEPGSKSA